MTDLLDRLPYARFLGLTTAADGQTLTVTMPFAQKLIGNPVLPVLHGPPILPPPGFEQGAPEPSLPEQVRWEIREDVLAGERTVRVGERAPMARLARQPPY